MRHSHDIIVHAIVDSILFIKNSQGADGSFAGLSAPHGGGFSAAGSRVTTFFASNIFHSLHEVHSLGGAFLPLEIQEMIEGMSADIAAFLEGRRHPSWTFNYYAGPSEFPDDWDDTALALAAIDARRGLSPEALASAARLLVASEISPGGPYATWLVADEKGFPAAADVAVNANIGFFLSKRGVHVPRLDDFLLNSFLEGRLDSPFYPSDFHALYFISRYFSKAGQCRFTQEKAVAALPSSPPADPLQIAMYLSAVCRLGIFGPTSAHELASALLEGGGYRPHPFCADPARDGVPYFGGSSALTAAFAAEALSHYLAATALSPAAHPTDPIERIRNGVKRKFADLEPSLRDSMFRMLDTAPSEAVPPILFDLNSGMDDAALWKISEGALCGWLAYDIFDDLYDGEPKGSALLSVAILLFAELISAQSSSATFPNIIKRIASADASGLYDPSLRSAGYAAAPLAVLEAGGHPPGSPASLAIASCIEHYFIARQLHDDAHDWEDDLCAGRKTFVTGLVADAFTGDRPERPISMPSDMPRLRTLFWNKVIDEVSHSIRAHIFTAMEALRSPEIAELLIPGFPHMKAALDRLEISASSTVLERDNIITFLSLLPFPGT